MVFISSAAHCPVSSLPLLTASNLPELNVFMNTHYPKYLQWEMPQLPSVDSATKFYSPQDVTHATEFISDPARLAIFSDFLEKIISLSTDTAQKEPGFKTTVYAALDMEWCPEYFRLPGVSERGGSIIQIGFGVLSGKWDGKRRLEFTEKRCFILDIDRDSSGILGQVDAVLQKLFECQTIVKLGMIHCCRCSPLSQGLISSRICEC